jgi:hypothetical protein
MPPLPEEIILMLAPFAPLFSRRVWDYAQSLLLGAILTPGAHTVAAALRLLGLSGERHFTNDHRVLNRATWSALPASRILWGLLVARLVPPRAPIALGAAHTVGFIPHRCKGGRLLSNFGDCGWLKHNHHEQVEGGTLECPL